MKNIFILFLTLLVNVSFAQIPELAKRTINGKSVTSDFQNQQTYMVNVDTLNWSKETVSGNFTYYQKKEEMVDRINSIFLKLKLKNITHFAEIKDNPFMQPRKLQWVMFADGYRIDWWFSNYDTTKLETITLVKN